jgi:hypothetical protein
MHGLGQCPDNISDKSDCNNILLLFVNTKRTSKWVLFYDLGLEKNETSSILQSNSF